MDGSSNATNHPGQAEARHPLADIGARFAAVMAPAAAEAEEPVDLAAYLLDPPPSAARVEQLDRRRRIVRIGSLVGAGVLVVVLLAPLPHGGGDEGGRAERPTASSATSREDDVRYPVRVDTATGGAQARVVHARPTRRARPVTRRSSAMASPARVLHVQTAPARSGSPAPVARPVVSQPARRPAQTSGGGSTVQAAGGGGAGASVAGSGGSAGSPPIAHGAATNTSSDAPTSEDGVGTSG